MLFTENKKLEDCINGLVKNFENAVIETLGGLDEDERLTIKFIKTGKEAVDVSYCHQLGRL